MSATRSPRESPEAGSSSSMSVGSVARAMRDLELTLLAVGDVPDEVGQLGLEADEPGQVAGALAHLAVDGLAAEHAQVPLAGCRAPRGRGCPRRSGRGTAATSGTSVPSRAGCGPPAGPRRRPRPRNSMVPEVCGMSPEMRLNSVVFPAPLGPRIARRSPGATSRSTSRTACSPPNRRPTPRRRRIGPDGSVTTSVTSWPLAADDLDGLALADPRQVALLAARATCGPERGVSGPNVPPNVWSTSGIALTVFTASLPPFSYSCWSKTVRTAWRLSSSLIVAVRGRAAPSSPAPPAACSGRRCRP